MGETLRALGEILLNAVPTFLLVVLLHLYIKKMFFQPLEKVLRQRFEATEGARKLAEQALARASARTAAYESKIRAAKSEIYQSQEETFRHLQEGQDLQVAEAHTRAQAAASEAKAQIAREVAEAKVTLTQTAESVSTEIADKLLKGNAA